MLVKLTVEWPNGDRNSADTEIEHLETVVKAMFKINAISITIEKVEEGE